jgi:hypothetical protein
MGSIWRILFVSNKYSAFRSQLELLFPKQVGIYDDNKKAMVLSPVG